MKKNSKLIILIIIAFLFLTIVILNYYNIIPKKTYTNTDFNIETIISELDHDNDGIDDYQDILLGARAFVSTKPKYKSVYYNNGYPPLGIGVCTDVIWFALQEAGYNLKQLVDEDIENNTILYPNVNKPDPNIDFRRVKNLQVFFKRNTINLTTDITEIASWQAGDIVVFTNHIGIISDKRNKKGTPYLIHHGGQIKYEEDALDRFTIVGHYRFKLNNDL